MSIKQALAFAAKQLQAKQIKNPLFEAELLLAFALKKEREFLLAYPEKQISASVLTKYKKFINARARNTPFAYLCGYKYFYGLKFIVNKNVLVPRPETEMLVEEVLHRTGGMQPAIIIDIGTGSGCIPIAIAKELGLKASSSCFFAGDISATALAIAKKNARCHDVAAAIKFYKGDLLEPFLKLLNKPQIIEHYAQIFITANLPYLAPRQIKASPTIQKEPWLALAAGKDGLKYYRKLFKQIRALAFPLPEITLLIEIDHTQKNSLQKLLKQIFPQADFAIKKDLGGHYRLVIIKIKN